jgi:hypothetical protein
MTNINSLVDVNNDINKTNIQLQKIGLSSLTVSNIANAIIPTNNIVFMMEPYKYTITTPINMTRFVDQSGKGNNFSFRTGKENFPIVKNDIKLFDNNVTYLDMPYDPTKVTFTVTRDPVTNVETTTTNTNTNFAVAVRSLSQLQITDDHTIEIFCIPPIDKIPSVGTTLYAMVSSSTSGGISMSQCLFPRGDGRIQYNVYGNTTNDRLITNFLNPPNYFPPNTLCHTVLRFGRNSTVQKSTIINGIPNNSPLNDAPIIGDWAGFISLFSATNGNNNWFGKVLAIRIYNTVLTNDQIIANYNNFINYFSNYATQPKQPFTAI